MRGQITYPILLLFLLNSVTSMALYSETELRHEFERAANCRKSALELNHKLQSLSSPTALERAYLGATLAILGRDTFLPWNKYSYCEQSVHQLSHAVQQDPSNAEIRFLRLLIQSRIPDFLGLSRNMEEDRKFLLTRQHKIDDEPLKNRICRLLKELKYTKESCMIQTADFNHTNKITRRFTA